MSKCGTSLGESLQAVFLNCLWKYPEPHVKYFHPMDVFGQFYVSVRSLPVRESWQYHTKNIFHCGILVPLGSLTSVLLMVLLLPPALPPIKLTVAVCCSLILLSTWISLPYLCLWRKHTFILLKIKSMGRNVFLLRLICKSFCG